MRMPRITSQRIPRWARELVDELRERHLLPVVIALGVAIVAVPLLFSADPESPPAEGLQAQPDGASAGSASGAGSISVLAYDPGLRKYRQRLDRLSPKDPFKQQYLEPVTEAAELGEGLSTSVGGGTGGGGSVPGGSGPAPPPPSPPQPSEPQVVDYRIVVFAGEAGSLERRGIAPLTPLPSATTPVVVFLDATSDGQKALFIISSEATLLSGGGTCVIEDGKPEAGQGEDGEGEAGVACQVMSLKPGELANLSYAVDGKTYRVKLMRIKPVFESE